MWKSQEELHNHNVSLNCSSFTSEEMYFLNLLRGVTTTLCALITVVILFYLTYCKAYSSLFQRLYLYLVIGTLFCEIVYAVTLDHLYQGRETVCAWVGFFSEWSHLQASILSYENIVYLLYLVVSKIKGARATLFPRWVRESKCYAITVESVFIALPVVISTVLATLPIVKKRSYGISGPWCWIRTFNDECEPIGFVTEVVFLCMYMAVGIVGMTVSIVFMMVYFKLANRYTKAQCLLKQTLYIMIFQLFQILSVSYTLALRLYTLLTQQYQGYGLWIITALNSPIGALILPLGYLLCFYSIRKTVLMAGKRVTQTLCFKQKNNASVNEQGSVILSRYTTAPVSDRISQPSYTYFDVEHPDMSSEISSLNVGDTDYGSTK